MNDVDFITCQKCNRDADEFTVEEYNHCIKNGWYCCSCRPINSCDHEKCGLCNSNSDNDGAVSMMMVLIGGFLSRHL